MSPMCNEKERTTYVGVVMKSEIHVIYLVAIMVGSNDVGDESSRSLTLPEAVDEQGVECGVVLTQLLQETQDDTNADEPSFIGNNETLLNMEPVSGSVGVGVGDVVADMGMILGVDPQPIATVVALIVDVFSVEPEFMSEYDATFRDERAEDSADDRPVLELSNRDKVLLQRALAEHAPEVPNC
jgi:hypothetical protein